MVLGAGHRRGSATRHNAISYAAQMHRLVLASASPARRTLLRSAGIPVDVEVSGVDEDAVEASSPQALSLTLARLKAQAVAERLAGTPGSGRLVLGCDSVLGLAGQILGKPADAAEAVARWRRMSGSSGVLYPGHCLIDLDSGKRAEGAARTTVHFADVTEQEIEAYVATGEPLAVAGSFTIDGRGSAFVESVEGDPGTVIGLSMPLLRHLLAELGVGIIELWAPVGD
jgi:septum formation protein